MNVTSGSYSQSGPQCMFKQMDGVRQGRCMDGESDRTQPGGEIQVFPCRKRWHQTFSFGNGIQTPKGSIHMNVPLHIQNRIKSKGKTQEPHMCVGVLGRGNNDEDDWDNENSDRNDVTKDVGSAKQTKQLSVDLLPLSSWEDEQLVTTRCSNIGGVIKWIFVPFIDESDANYVIMDEDNTREEMDDKAKHKKNEIEL